MKRSLTLALIVVLALVSGTGCDTDSGSKTEAPKLRMTVNTDKLSPLKEGFTYKVWLKVGLEYVASDGFNVTSNGQFTTPFGESRDKSFVLASDVKDAELVLISVEGKTGNAVTPSSSIVLAADVTGSEVQLTTAHALALGSSLAGKSGQLTIMTPSDTDAANEAYGVWFLTVSNGVMSPGLTLHALNPGWIYEGWVEVGGHVYSTGTFSSTNNTDNHQPHSFNDVPQFPGEDFLLNPPTGVTFPLNLGGAVVTITAEPVPDDSFEPSGIKVLSAQLPSTVQGGAVYQLSGAGAVLPTATVTIF